MERPAVIGDGHQTIPGLKFGRSGAEPGLLSRYTVFRTMHGAVLVLQDKETGERLTPSVAPRDPKRRRVEAGMPVMWPPLALAAENLRLEP